MAQEPCPICGRGYAGHSDRQCAKYVVERRKEEGLANAAASVALRKGTPRIVLVTMLVVAGLFVAVVIGFGMAASSSASPRPSVDANNAAPPSGRARHAPRHVRPSQPPE